MATFESSLKPRLIYVFAINDEWHSDCLKIGETTLEEGEGDLLAPNSEQLNKAARKRIDQYTKTAGTYNWRKISGTNRQSAHSYGIAIDIGVAQSNYWKWDNPHKKETDKIQYNNRIPIELVEIFEPTHMASIVTKYLVEGQIAILKSPRVNRNQ